MPAGSHNLPDDFRTLVISAKALSSVGLAKDLVAMAHGIARLDQVAKSQLVRGLAPCRKRAPCNSIHPCGYRARPCCMGRLHESKALARTVIDSYIFAAPLSPFFPQCICVFALGNERADRFFSVVVFAHLPGFMGRNRRSCRSNGALLLRGRTPSVWPSDLECVADRLSNLLSIYLSYPTSRSCCCSTNPM